MAHKQLSQYSHLIMSVLGKCEHWVIVFMQIVRPMLSLGLMAFHSKLRPEVHYCGNQSGKNMRSGYAALSCTD